MPSKKITVMSILIIGLLLVAWTVRPIFIAILNPLLPHQIHGQLTGDAATCNSTVYNVVGTDLGIIVEHNGQYFYIFGDTFGAVTSWGNHWRSNTLAISEDTDPSNGIALTNWIRDPTTGYAKELIPSLKVDNVEMTCIPTAAVSIEGNLYVFYMSVRHWSDEGGVWTCNNASIAVSMDNGQTFTKLSNISWPGDSNFVQFGIAQDSHLTLDSSWLYLLATPAGRFGACYLCRVETSQILNQTAYEYFMGVNAVSNPLWTGNPDLAEPLFSAPVGELSVMWNQFLGQWTVFYTDNVAFSIVVRTGDALWGMWSNPKTIVTAAEYPSLYGSFVHPDFVEDNGQKIYFIMSLFSEYNTYVMSVDLSSLKESE